MVSNIHLPLVSILIPCYNAEQWIAQAIESALNQTYPSKEVIVVDDGSTDGSLEIIKSFGDVIRWETGPNRGGNIARNRLLELSTGAWVQYLDADDYLLPDKIENQIKFLGNSDSLADIVYSPVIVEYPNSDFDNFLSVLPDPTEPLMLLIRWKLPQTGGCLLRKETVIELGGWKPDQPCCQEYELYFRFLINKKKFLYCSMSGAVYRVFGKNTVSSKKISETYRYRLLIIDRIEKYILNTQIPNSRIYLNIIDQERLSCARIIWNFDKRWATNIVKTLNGKRDFKLSSKDFTCAYCWSYRLLGFSLSEYLALFKRVFIRWSGKLVLKQSMQL